MVSTASTADSSPATRAKALLDEAPGAYALRKRRRDSSSQTAIADSPTASQGTRTRTEGVIRSTEVVATGSPSPATVNGLTDDVTATATGAPPTLQPPSSVTHGQALPAPAPSASTSQAPMLSGQEGSDDGDHSGDESDLTSLSELEERLERETAQLPPRPRRARDISGRKTPRKRKTALSTAASSPAASSAASTAASEYRPADGTDHGGSSELDPALAMDVDEPRPRKVSANPKVRKKVSKKQQQASKPRRVAAASKAPPVERPPPAPAATLQASHAQTPRPIKPAPASADKVLHMDVVALPPPTPPTQAPKRKRALPQANSAQALLPLAPAQEQRDALPTGTPRLTRLTRIFQPAAMPSVMNLYERRHQVLKDARLEATGGLAFQLRSEALIEAAISALDRRDQQDGLCLTMNRYSAFCDLKSVDVPPFPVTAAKVALFLARAPATALSTLLLSAFPQPARFPLPIAGGADPNLTAVEGTRVSRELVRFWVEALAYAQRATNEVWAPIFGGAGPVQQGPQPDHVHPSLEPLQNNVAIQEILAAVETSESIVHADEMARQTRENRRDASPISDTRTTAVAEASQPAKQGKTKWIKGGKPVAPPPPAPPPPSSSSSGKTASSDQGVTCPAPINNPIETRHARPATHNDPTQPAARHPLTKPVELWQVTNAQVSPVLPIASAPISIPGLQASVASTSHATLDFGRRRRSTTSDLAWIDHRVPLPSASGQQQQQEHQQHRHRHQQHQQYYQHQQQQRPQTWQHANDFPPPVPVGDAHALQETHPSQDPYPWAEQFPHQAFAMPPESARRHSRASTYAFELSHAAHWELPYEAANGTDAADYATPFAVQQPVTQLSFDQVPLDGYLDENTAERDGYGYGAASGNALPIGASPFDMLAAVANDRMSAEPDLSQHIASYEPRLPLNSVNGEGVLAGAATSVPMRRGIEHFAGTTSQGGLQTPWASSDSTRRGSRAEPFDPSLADPSLSGLLHTRSQPHDHTFVASDSHFGHIADSALASIGPLDAGMTYDAASVSHAHPQPTPYVRPSTYPTRDSPSTKRWPMQQENTSWAASPAGIDAAFLQQVWSEQVGPATENNLEPPAAGAPSSSSSYTAYGLGLSYA